MFCLCVLKFYLFDWFAIVSDQHNNFQVNNSIVFLELQFFSQDFFLENKIYIPLIFLLNMKATQLLCSFWLIIHLGLMLNMRV